MQSQIIDPNISHKDDIQFFFMDDLEDIQFFYFALWYLFMISR